MILYPTNACPFHCIFCDYSELNDQKKKALKKVEWEYLLSEFKNNGGMAIELCGGGEPLATPDVDQLIDCAARMDLRVGILTNGLFINKEKYPKIYSSILDHCSYVRVSMESASQEIFKKVRRRGDTFSFDTIFKNISQLIQDKSEDIQVSYKYNIGSIYDFNDVCRAITLAEEAGFDSVQFKTACNVEEDFKEDRKEVEQKIKSFAARTLHTTKLLCNFTKYNLSKKDSCFMSAVHTLIDYNGDVFICCYYRHRIQSHRIGNVFKKSFYDIWHSYEHWKKMKEINVEECNLYDCRFIKYNELMDHALKTGQLEFI